MDEGLSGQNHTADFLVLVHFLDSGREFVENLGVGGIEFIRAVESKDGDAALFLFHLYHLVCHASSLGDELISICFLCAIPFGLLNELEFLDSRRFGNRAIR